MRFAGSKLEDFMSKSTDFGQIAESGSAIRSNDVVAGIKRQSDGVNMGIGAAGEVERAALDAKAQAAIAQGQQQANTMSTIGGVISSGISALPSLGGKVNFGSSDWTNTQASFANYAKSYL